VTAVVFEDRWGEILDRETEDLVEFRWFDTTADMSADEFKASLANFATCVEKCRRHHVLVDNTNFRMDPSRMDGPWRDANIIPRYNAAGVTKFAFQMPPGMQMIGSPPAEEGPSRFPTAYFGRRQEALDWLAKS
jgi:hypothetical protein